MSQDFTTESSSLSVMNAVKLTVREDAFRRDLVAYKLARARLLPEHVGEFVLIHKGEFIGLYPSEKSAYEAWQERFPGSDVIISELLFVEPVARISC